MTALTSSEAAVPSSLPPAQRRISRRIASIAESATLAVELLVGQLGEGVGGVVVAARLLVAHCASLASWWWRPGGALSSVGRPVVVLGGRGDRT